MNKILVIDKIELALSNSTKNDLIIFDIDNCILHAEEPAVRDEWWDHMVQNYINQQYSIINAKDEASKLFNKLQPYSKHHLVDSSTNLANKIQLLKSDGVFIVGLTARGAPITDITISQLNELDFKFSDLTLKSSFQYNSKEIKIQDNVIFCHDQPKGEILELSERYFSKSFGDFNKIIFIDDKYENCSCVGRVLAKHNLNHCLYHYVHMSNHMPFDDKELNIAKTQYQHFIENNVFINKQKILKGYT